MRRIKAWRGAAFGVLLSALLLPSACLSAFAESAAANDDFYRTCSNPNHVGICTPEERNRRLAAFGLPPLEEQVRKARQKNIDSEIIVAMFTRRNNVGIAMMFRRDRKGQPLVTIRRRGLVGERIRSWGTSTGITEASWDRIIGSASEFDTPVDVDIVCVGGGLLAVEFADRDGKLRAHLVDTCYGSPTSAYVMALADEAVKAFPACRALQYDYEVRPLHRLLDCFPVSSAAAE